MCIGAESLGDSGIHKGYQKNSVCQEIVHECGAVYSVYDLRVHFCIVLENVLEVRVHYLFNKFMYTIRLYTTLLENNVCGWCRVYTTFRIRVVYLKMSVHSPFHAAVYPLPKSTLWASLFYVSSVHMPSLLSLFLHSW